MQLAEKDLRNTLCSRYSGLDAASRRLMQLIAVLHQSVGFYWLIDTAKKLKLRDSSGKSFTQRALKQQLITLQSKKLLTGSNSSAFMVPRLIQDFVIQDSVRQGTFPQLRDFASDLGFYYSDGREARCLRLAFYAGNVEEVRANFNSRHAPDVGLLQPFSRDIFDRLDPILQELYLCDAMPRLIIDADGDRSPLVAFDAMAASGAQLPDPFLAAMLDLAIARGSLTALDQVDQLTGGRFPEVAGCRALLRGEHEQAAQLLFRAIQGKKSARSLAPARHLPGVLYGLLAFRDSSPTIAQAMAMIAATRKSRNSPFAGPLDVLDRGLQFKQLPASHKQFARDLQSLCRSPLETLLAGYLSRWLLSDGDGALEVNGLAQPIEAFSATGFDWLAAEAAALAACASSKPAAKRSTQRRDGHAKLGTASLIPWIEPEQQWARALDAIAQLAETGSAAAELTEANERVIFELEPRDHSVHMEVFQQSRQRGSWSKGRKISLQRLYERFNNPEFAFLTEQDRALCRSLRTWTERNYYGYAETCCEFNSLQAARAMVGHPRIYPVGDRDNPYQIVEQPPRLVVTREDGEDRLSLMMDPPLLDSDEQFRMSRCGSRQLLLTFFDEQHRKLYKLLEGKLSVPAAAAGKVIDSIQRIASLVMVHSEIGDAPSDATSASRIARVVAGNPTPHVHLLPYQDGLKLEFYVRPFGDAGPLCRPGVGGTTLYAHIEGEPRTARRDLEQERQLCEQAVADCPEIATWAVQEHTACCPSPLDALQALLELEDLVQAQRAVLHWPQGTPFKIAGRASTSQFRISIRRDRDWFAASGELKVDPTLSLDMMRLIELVESGCGRFIKLDDGRFLALTEELRQRIDDLSNFGDRRTHQDKLRFPRTHAALFEDLGDVQLRTDTHWKQWVRRMREAEQICPNVPTTMQTELREYQLEGFRWLARLSTWGVGGCLADDMGLGKTIQAIALLLHRATEGPALVVAPTSVILNWHSELQRFAPTLNPHVFAESDRRSLLSSLQPRDVVLCSYGLLHTHAAAFHKAAWDTVILDEAQAIKNFATQRSQAAKGLKAEFRLIMTGTPMENHLGELWNLMDFINPGLLGSPDSFQCRFALPIERDQCRESRRRLKKLIQPFILRRTKSQVLTELPARTEVTLHVELSAEEAAFYEALRQRAVAKLASVGEDKSQHLQVLAEIMRLRRACCHPRMVVEDCGIAGSKLALFSKTIDELLDNHHQVLVFSQFVDHLTILREELDRKQVAYQYLDGSTTARQRQERVEAFQSGQGSVFLISLKAGGTGLNLTAADYVIHMDPWWNPAVEDQASDRAHRLGQQRPVTIYRFITEGTIEQRICALHATKRDLADSLLDGTDLSGRLSTEELLNLIRN